MGVEYLWKFAQETGSNGCLRDWEWENQMGVGQSLLCTLLYLLHFIPCAHDVLKID